MSKDVAGSNPAMCNIHRSLMVRIAGFHPEDPGSIPGDEGSSGNDVKSNMETGGLTYKGVPRDLF